MNICLIVGSLLSFTTGIEIQVKRAGEALIKRGHRVSVITTVANTSEKPYIKELEGASIYQFSTLNSYRRSDRGELAWLMRPLWFGGDVWNFRASRMVKHILEKEKPDVVHIHNARGLSLSIFGMVKDMGFPLVFTAHDYSLICPRYSLLRGSGETCPRPRLVCRVVNGLKGLLVDNKPDLVTAPSQFVIDKLKENGLFKRTRTMKLPNAISLDDACLYEKRYDTVDILYSGQLSRAKGVHVLIDAFKRIEHKNVRLHIAGRGRYAEQLEKAARGDARITFHGFMEWDKLKELYQKASVTVVPSLWYEPFGLILIESFKYGTPIVASSTGGISEIVEHGHNGFLFEAGNVNQLKETLESLIENPEELRRLSLGAFESVKRFDINTHVIQLEELYQQVIN